MRLVVLEAGIRHPAYILAVFKVSSQRKGILRMPFRAQAERLNAKKQLLCRKWVQRSSEISENLDPGTNDKSDAAKRLPELETVVAVGWLDKLRESLAVLTPVKLAAVDKYTSNGRAVAAYPFGRRVDDNVCAVIYGADKVAACAKSVVDLDICQSRMTGVPALILETLLQEEERPFREPPWQ